jgi:hypothetical protein
MMATILAAWSLATVASSVRMLLARCLATADSIPDTTSARSSASRSPWISPPP